MFCYCWWLGISGRQSLLISVSCPIWLVIIKWNLISVPSRVLNKCYFVVTDRSSSMSVIWALWHNLIGNTNSVISYLLRDIYFIYRCCWNVDAYKWKVHNGKIVIISRWYLCNQCLPSCIRVSQTNKTNRDITKK